MRFTCLRGAMAVGLLCLAIVSSAWAEPAGRLRVTTFRSDITPALGQPLEDCDLIHTIEQPLLAKGIVLDEAGTRYVICALDWCMLCNGSYDSIRSKIANAAGADVSRVALQTVHQHTAPQVDIDARNMMVAIGVEHGAHLDPDVLADIEQRLVAAVQQSLGKFQTVDHIGTGQAKVDRVAANRRVRDAEGKLVFRASRCNDPAIRDLPEGTIDPYVKTITFSQGDKPVVRIHYYATHPQTFYCDGRASSDLPGDVREALEKKENVFQMYFDGCGGDLAMGKYNDGSRKCRDELAERLLAGMEASVAATSYVPVSPIRWRTYPLNLPRRTDPGFTVPDFIVHMNDANRDMCTRWSMGAMPILFYQRSNQPIELTSLQMGNTYIVHLPGEPFIEFQLFAQKVKPGAFVAVAGYGDYAPGYLCTEQAFKDGGYEPTDSFIKPESEHLIKKAISALLGVE